ncbi:hypothetical protein CoNPh11_CDS0148 [Staphylococcus phage S-CoN_Ph11]|nr:hypothetical protein CoNPh1_CDS0055 [Staphylococcus phage S-CoN_Ph1]WNM51657.1 hypothetical protein CoNPh2_CDS0103 [Staphylococcus phage S-CoN_Ph2]WNM51819.1 hypothetical protein CoNPh3_CDS0105 [Staphylococcus phage S-CoN_Ph3]WNM51936.1 hypothetical protein CoNPh4_CDS0060 [Staphylococcus phage S-CoN_Ph4]WNM52119.1 hypothetical protein CoNPh5_CDS0073 [Staphylococcus phage S-CoN_Ph5]WNM52318.1 hypothetical protein CoNPh6_CDS0108 [Staphylococcus phage S-CoN_Ph6]WNM52489.1 hypothetical protein
MVELEKSNIKKRIEIGDLIEIDDIDCLLEKVKTVGIVVKDGLGYNIVMLENALIGEEVHLRHSSPRTLDEINNFENYHLLVKSKQYNIKITY